jgi:hypothetical protein
MPSTEVREWNAILDGGFGKAKSRYKDCTSIWACNSMQAVEQYTKISLVRSQELLDFWEIEDPL